MKKNIYSFITTILIFLTPWYVPAILAILGTIFFNSFIFVIFVGFLIDVFYSEPNSFGLFFTIISFCIYILSLFIKDRIRI